MTGRRVLAHHRGYDRPLKPTTLGILRRDDHICLAMKKRGFGVGLWNFAGGKTEPGETARDGVKREIKQEFGTVVKRARLVAQLYFYFADVPVEKNWDQCCSVFAIDTWRGEPGESEEMAPRWWRRDHLPYAKMWAADRDWIEPVLDGYRLTGFFLFSANGECLDQQITLGRIIKPKG